MDRTLLSTVGSYTAAKIDFLDAARARIDLETGRREGIRVNAQHCRPLHPHGQKMVEDGLMKVRRTSALGPRTSYTTLVITDKGLDELGRLENRMRKREKRHANTNFQPPRQRRSKLSPAKVIQTRNERRAKAIALLKQALAESRKKPAHLTLVAAE